MAEPAVKKLNENGVVKTTSVVSLILCAISMVLKLVTAILGGTSIQIIDCEDEDGMKSFLGTLTDVTVTDISDKIPTQDELDAYVGKTLGDLEEAGFENTGFSGEDGINQFFYDGPIYCCTVTLADGVVVEDMDDYSANDLRALKIGAVEYTGLSGMLIENL